MANIRALPGPPMLFSNGPGRLSKVQKYIISYINPIQEVKNALNGLKADEWKAAIDSEYAALIRNGTWTLTEFPDNSRAIKTRWILTEKKEDGI